MRFLNKKGISPLIATVLLIGFTVALAGVVITWGGGFIKNITEGTEERTASTLACAGDLNFEITKVKCANDNALGEITVDNKGDLALHKIAFRFFDVNDDSKGSEQKAGADANTPLVGPFEIKKVELVAKLIEGVSRVDAIATVKVEGQEVVCSDAVRVKEFTPGCPA
ncbi:MAG: archaellin/type IV pilin N-terminal domain-containing protein [Nanoarchaeota archaeon]